MSTKISKILHLAADRYLSPSTDTGASKYSCDAIAFACDELLSKHSDPFYIERIIKTGLFELGLDPRGLHEFDDIPEKHRQATRYQWLKFCALLAEEQDV